MANELTYSDSEIARFLLQAQFSASDLDIDSVRSLGYMGWLIAQFNQPVTSTGTQWLDSQNLFIPLKSGNYFDPTLGDWMAWQQVMTGNDQLRRRLALARRRLSAGGRPARRRRDRGAARDLAGLRGRRRHASGGSVSA